MPSDRELRALLRFGLDKQTLQKTKDGVITIEEALKHVETRAEQTQRKMEVLRRAANIGQQISQGFTAAGAAITGPLLLSLNAYVQHAGRAETTSRDWLNTMDRLSQSQQRIGRIVADTVLPTLEKAADIAEDAAQFAEEHPDLIKAALNVGTVMLALGTAGSAVSRMAMMVTEIGSILAATQKLVAGSAGAAAVGKVAGGAALGGGVGGAVAVGGLTAIGALFQGGLFIGMTKIVDSITDKLFGRDVYTGFDLFTDAVDKFTGFITGQSGEGTSEPSSTGAAGTAATDWTLAQDAYISYRETAIEAERSYQDQRLSLITAYEEQRDSAERNYEQRRNQIVEDYQRQRATIEASYARQEARLLADHRAELVRMAEDYARQSAQAEEEYYLARAERASQYGVEVQRAEEDHQRRMQQLRRSYERQLEDAVVGRDAIAIYRARRDYEDQRRDEEENYQVQARRASEDYAREIAQMEQQFQRQQQLREEDYQQRSAETIAQFEEERTQRAEDHAMEMEEMRQDAEERLQELDREHLDEMRQMYEQHHATLSELDTQYQRERMQRDYAFRRQLWDLGVFLGNEQRTAQEYQAAMQRDFATWWEQMNRVLTQPIQGPSVSGQSITVTSRTTINGQSTSALGMMLDQRDAILKREIYGTIDRMMR
jgi:hypothetical protein